MEMFLEDLNEDVMTRFLLGESPSDEQELVENRFLSDPAFFENLCSFEEELLLAHVRGELPETLQARVETALANWPGGRRRVSEIRALVATMQLDAMHHPVPTLSPLAPRRRGPIT